MSMRGRRPILIDRCIYEIMVIRKEVLKIKQ